MEEIAQAADAISAAFGKVQLAIGWDKLGQGHAWDDPAPTEYERRKNQRKPPWCGMHGDYAGFCAIIDAGRDMWEPADCDICKHREEAWTPRPTKTPYGKESRAAPKPAQEASLDDTENDLFPPAENILRQCFNGIIVSLCAIGITCHHWFIKVQMT